MKPQLLSVSVVQYLLNCILLLLPIMAWNVIFSGKLPVLYSREVFWKNIPPFIANGENIFRLIVFVLPVLMPIRIETQSQKLGLWLYITGTTIYLFHGWRRFTFRKVHGAYAPWVF
jgi:hypothetical protein